MDFWNRVVDTEAQIHGDLLMRTGVILLSSTVFLGGIVAGIVLTGQLRSRSQSEAAPAAEVVPKPEMVFPELTEPPAFSDQALAPPLPSSEASALPSFSNVAEQTISAVTNISSRQVVRQRSLFDDDPFFRYFFGNSGDLFSYRERENLGSGVVVSKEGYVLTNAHVIGRQSSGVTVTLADEREFEAEVVGRDESTDIALLRIPDDDLPTVPWGDSSRLRIAEWVLAVGNPFQLNQTVTLGIVSAIGRDNLGVAQYEDFIQTDAAINPGNSGGALINTRGELVGINTAIYSESGGYQGVGFAVPSNLARRVMQDLVDYGKVRRGSFGYMVVRPLRPQLAHELGALDTQGIVVWQIDQRSAAARAGIEPGDIIVMFNNEPIEDMSDYARLLSDATIGSTATLGIIRADQRFKLEIEVSQAHQQ